MLIAEEYPLLYEKIQRYIGAVALITAQQSGHHSQVCGHSHLKNEFYKIAVRFLFGYHIKAVEEKPVYVVCGLPCGNGAGYYLGKIGRKGKLLHIKTKPVEYLHRLAAVKVVPARPLPETEL